MPSKIIFDSETEDNTTMGEDSGTAAEATPAKKIKKIKDKDGKKIKKNKQPEVEEEQPDCEPPVPKKKKKDKRAADQTSDGAIDLNGNCNGVDTTPEKNTNAEPDTEETEKKIKKKKKKLTEETTDEASPQTNGHSTPNTPVETPSQSPVETPSQSSDDSDIDSEKATETTEQKEGAFSNFNLSQHTISRLKARGISYLFDIQIKTFKAVSVGKDVIGQARTGTGKTFAFAIPLVEKLQNDPAPLSRGRPPKVLVLTPTRELAIQVHKDFKDITKKLSVTCFYGGSSYNPQMDAIRSGIDVLVGTPGRIKDHLQNNKLDLTQLKHVVLDEVDQMLDMGFADQVEEILSCAYEKDADTNPQTLLFSATCPAWVYNVAKKYMKPGYTHVDLIGTKLSRAATTVEHLAIACHWSQRAAVLGDVIQVYSGSNGKTIVFCETKKEADELAMNPLIRQTCCALHGDIVQKQREITLKGFRTGSFEVLVATNVAARGLDIPEVDLVIQCGPPSDVESYIHRSGRTGRAGRTGQCICLYQRRDEEQLRYVEYKAGLTFRRVGVPTAEELVKSSSDETLKCLESVSPAAIARFKETAEKLIEEKGAVEALAAALAHISGATDMEQRSLLNSESGYTTLKMECSQEMHSMSYAWRSLKEQLGDEIEQHIQRMCCLKDQKGVCFDVPSDQVKEMQDNWKDGRRWQLIVCTELPDIVERQGGGGGGGGGGRGFRGNGGGGRSFGGGGRGGGGRGGGRGRGGSGGFRGGQKRSFSSAFK